VLSRRLDDIRQRIQQACRRCGRAPDSVTLVGVTKGVPPERIEEAIRAGLTDLGENRVQEAAAKQLAQGSRLKAQGEDSSLQPSAFSLERVRWHMVGHLQRNKAKEAVELFDVIHSVDSLKLIEELERQAAKLAQGSRLKAQGKRIRRVEVFLQVNIAQEATKFGCTPEDAMQLAAAVRRCPHLSLRGLMTIPPFTEDPVGARGYFRGLRTLRDQLAGALSLEPSALSLSMGMSHDFEVAIEEGADLVRIGTGIFGARAS